MLLDNDARPLLIDTAPKINRTREVIITPHSLKAGTIAHCDMLAPSLLQLPEVELPDILIPPQIVPVECNLSRIQHSVRNRLIWISNLPLIVIRFFSPEIYRCWGLLRIIRLPTSVRFLRLSKFVTGSDNEEFVSIIRSPVITVQKLKASNSAWVAVPCDPQAY